VSAAPSTGLAEAIRTERSATIDRLGTEPILWLAAAPLWSGDVAEAARFPTGPAGSVGEFVRLACAAGWCDTRGDLDGEDAEELRFWMPDEARRDVLALLAQRPGADLKGTATRIALHIAALDMSFASAARAPDVPAALRDWAELMTDSAPELALVERVRMAVEAEDLAGAQQFVMAGEAMAPVLAGTAELALDRARRLLSLGARRRQDRRALGRYLDRRELSDAVADLLAPGAGSWALHLRGVGGVGKTMLIRYLASGRYAAERKLPSFPVARADFDHVSPDYPVRLPVQLLVQLADELTLHAAADTRADRSMRRFRDAATSAHEALSAVREENAAALEHPLVLGAIDAFADVLADLPGTLLVLDTCEELAKADVGGLASPAVQATFTIIERLNERAPSARFLLAGRRPLPAHDDYLAVCKVAGFTVDEARRYLSEFARRPVAPRLADAMIRQSEAVEPGPEPAEAEPTAERGLPSRVSPFDLALYLSWADDDPGLNVRRVELGSDAYVEGRIIERLGDPLVRRALPLLAAAGRCRASTLASFLGADDRQAALLGLRLAEQEWIEADGDSPEHVAAMPALVRRLRRYYNAPDRAAEFVSVTTRLADVLRSRLRATPLPDIDLDELLAALRLASPADAAALWDSIAERATDPPGHWGWMLDVTRRVRGESAYEQWPTADALRATVLAAHIAARRRASAAYSPRHDWTEVRARADRHPEPNAAWVLRARGALGLLPYTPDDESLWADLVLPGVAMDAAAAALALGSASAQDVAAAPVNALSHLVRAPFTRVLAAAAVDAADRLLEAGELKAVERLFAEYAPTVGGRALRPTVNLLWDVDQVRAADDRGAGSRVRAWALVALGRLRADDEQATAFGYLADAETAAETGAARAEPAWADWIAPRDLLARTRIERGLIDAPDDAALDRWERYAADDLGRIDRERLASLCLRTRLDRGPIEGPVIERWAELDRYVPGRMPTCSAHDLVPPLCVTLAEAWLAIGQPDHALALIERRREEMLGDREENADEATQLALDSETIRIARRFRLTDQRYLLTRWADPGYQGSYGAADVARVPPPGDQESTRLVLTDDARRAIAVIFGEPQSAPGAEVTERPASWHAWWQCLRVLPGPPPNAPPTPRWPPDGPSTDLAADLELDLEEMRQLGYPRFGEDQQQLAGWLARPRREIPSARSADPIRDVRAALRRTALTEETPVSRTGVPGRRVAELAFEEAELLALRLPDAAARLFLLSFHAYGRDADDPLGRLLAAASCAALTGKSSHRELARESLSRVRDLMPTVSEALAGPIDEAGRWRYWAELTQRVLPVETDSASSLPWWQRAPDVKPPSAVLAPPPAPPRVQAPGAQPPRARRLPVVVGLAIVGVVIGVALAPTIAKLSLDTARTGSATANPGGSGFTLIDWLAVALGAVLVLAAVIIVAQLPRSSRLAAGRGIGALPLGSLLFDVTVSPAGVPQLRVEPRPVRDAPSRQWVRLVLSSPASWLARAVRRDKPTGYTAIPTAECHTWTDLAKERDRWWGKGADDAAGVIWLGRDNAGLPWERDLSASLGAGAAGRIEWARLLVTDAAAVSAVGATGVGFAAPAAWMRDLGRYYAASPVDSSETSKTAERASDPVRFRLRHAIGEAVRTSAGPRLDVSGAAAKRGGGGGELLGPRQLVQGSPAIVVLQAEPITGSMSDESAQGFREMSEWCELAVDLIEARTAAVLILPPLRASLARLVNQTIAGHVRTRRGDDARLLLHKLRRTVKDTADSAVCDDFVLFLNPRRYG
jgi:hypothetical protein